MIGFPSRARQDRTAADRLYARIVEQARRPEFYAAWSVPDTLDGRFEMLALHLFVLTNRLMRAPDGDPELARLVSEVFVTDMDAAFREMGVGDLTVPKRMKTLYRSFAGRATAYGKALAGGEDELVAAVERNVFPDGDPRRAALHLGRYLRASVEALAGVGTAALRDGEIPFPQPGTVEGSIG